MVGSFTTIPKVRLAMLIGFVQTYTAPLLKRHGFKKKDLTWNRSKDGLIQVINFQPSRFSRDDEISFTINLGEFNPFIWRNCWAKESPKFIREEDCFPRIRIGQLLSSTPGEAVDQWWTCHESTNGEVLGSEINKVLEEKCLKFLDDMLNCEQVARFYSSHFNHLMPIEKIYLAITKSCLGDIHSSHDLLDEVGTISVAWANRVEQVRSQLRSENGHISQRGNGG